MMNKIKAKVLCHTKHAYSGKEMVSFEIEMPRIILAELNTHKILVRNAQSSRAVPIKTTIENLKNGTTLFVPSYWGKNQSGMSASEECNENLTFFDCDKQEFYILNREHAWCSALEEAIRHADAYNAHGYHKQIAGRLLEPFMMIKLVLSGTEWDNFFNLRIHPAAEPHFRNLAIKIYLALRNSSPIELSPGEWHLPYIKYDFNDYGVLIYKNSQGEVLDLETARNISLSCVAQTSYRKHIETEEKAEIVLDRLFNGDVVHASPAEHLATPMQYVDQTDSNRLIDFIRHPEWWEEGITHVDRKGQCWSGQLKHFIQYRQLIPNNVCNEFTHEK